MGLLKSNFELRNFRGLGEELSFILERSILFNIIKLYTSVSCDWVPFLLKLGLLGSLLIREQWGSPIPLLDFQDIWGIWLGVTYPSHEVGEGEDVCEVPGNSDVSQKTILPQLFQLSPSKSLKIYFFLANPKYERHAIVMKHRCRRNVTRYHFLL